eukprot:UN28293
MIFHVFTTLVKRYMIFVQKCVVVLLPDLQQFVHLKYQAKVQLWHPPVFRQSLLLHYQRNNRQPNLRIILRPHQRIRQVKIQQGTHPQVYRVNYPPQPLQL